MIPMTDENIKDLLVFVARHDVADTLFWDSGLNFFANVNDSFFWACGDLEPITDSNVKDFKTAITDCKGESNGATLFAARIRGMRPQGALYKYIPKELWPLFDACGPGIEIW